MAVLAPMPSAERQDRDEGEARTLHEHPEAVLQVLKKHEISPQLSALSRQLLSARQGRDAIS